jgi:hypothetical protein
MRVNVSGSLAGKEPLAAMVPATRDVSTWVVLTGRLQASPSGSAPSHFASISSEKEALAFYFKSTESTMAWAEIKRSEAAI